MKQKTLLIILFVLSFLALADSTYLTYQHYSTGSSVFCDIGGSFNCDTASKSPYSTVDSIFYFLAVDKGLSVPIITISIPIAVISMVIFILIKVGALHIWHDRHIGKFSPSHMIWTIRGILIFSMFYGMWLIYVQSSILKAYCLYCLVLDLLILLSLIVSFMIKTEWKRNEINLKR